MSEKANFINLKHFTAYDLDDTLNDLLTSGQITWKENLHELYKLTISCESRNDIGPVHCDDCWWCMERKWAFGDYVKL